MSPQRIIAVAVTATLLLGGMVPVGAASPTEQTDPNSNEIESQEETDGVGSNDELPDHVSSILDSIDAFLSGSIDSLGETLRELLGTDTPDQPTESGADK